MRRFERLILCAAIGGLAPTAGFLVGWWGTRSFLLERGVALAALCGLAAGLILDALFLRRAVDRAHTVSLAWWAAAYLFYSVVSFGFSMGVPAFNALLVAPAAVSLAARLVEERATVAQLRRTARRFRLFITAVLGTACLASAALALIDPFTAANLEGMLGLPFEVTPAMIVALILLGGTSLIVLQWVLADAVLHWAYARLVREA